MDSQGFPPYPAEFRKAYYLEALTSRAEIRSSLSEASRRLGGHLTLSQRVERDFERDVEMLVRQLEHHLAANQLDSFTIQHPQTWWDHTKHRWFPRWWLKRWPVKWKRVHVKVHDAYPAIEIPNCPHNRHVTIVVTHPMCQWPEVQTTRSSAHV